jgi:hypothetical protein
VVVVRAADHPTVEVFDPTARAFYQGRAATDDEAMASFVITRARRAERRAREPAPAPTDARAREPAVAPPVEPAEPGPIEDDASPDEPRPARAFFRKNWAYFVVGGLLAAAVTAAFLSRRDTGPNDPVLRFRPGGG